MIPKIIIHTDVKKIEEYAENIIADLGFSKNHPDLMWFTPEEKLGIELARKIKDFLSLKPYQSKGQVIVLTTAQNLTPDAQNALLKTFEEHGEGVNLILGVEAEEQLFPTLVSRCHVIYLPSDKTDLNSEDDFRKEIDLLLTNSIEDRFKFIEKLGNKEKFLHALTAYFRHSLTLPMCKITHQECLSFLKDLVEAERWAKQNVNIRAILEYLMLKMPKK